MIRLVSIILISFMLVSCSAKFACKDKVDIEGEKCDPIRSVYEKKMLGEWEAEDKEKVRGSKEGKGKERSALAISEDTKAVRSLFYEEGKPIRLPPRVIRIWIAPWEDVDGDLHQPSYIFSEISPKRGRWLFGEKEMATSQPIFRPMDKTSDKEEETMGLQKGEEKDNEKPAKTGRGRERVTLPVQTEASGTRKERR